MNQFKVKNPLTGTAETYTFLKKITVTDIPWYIKLLLSFKKMQYGYDFGFEKSGVAIGYKELFGKTYVLCEIPLPEDIAALMREI